jgi:hypothetical protein
MKQEEKKINIWKPFASTLEKLKKYTCLLAFRSVLKFVKIRDLMYA